MMSDGARGDGRYYVTRDGRVIGGSEVGVIPVENSNVLSKGRLMPGKMFLIDFAQVLAPISSAFGPPSLVPLLLKS